MGLTSLIPKGCPFRSSTNDCLQLFICYLLFESEDRWINCVDPKGVRLTSKKKSKPMRKLQGLFHDPLYSHSANRICKLLSSNFTSPHKKRRSSELGVFFCFESALADSIWSWSYGEYKHTILWLMRFPVKQRKCRKIQ